MIDESPEVEWAREVIELRTRDRLLRLVGGLRALAPASDMLCECGAPCTHYSEVDGESYCDGCTPAVGLEAAE